MSIEQKEEQSTKQPTTLNLFRFPGQRYLEDAYYYLAGIRLNIQYDDVERSLDRLRSAIDTKKGRLNQTITELVDGSFARTESVSAGAAYLQLFDELSVKGVSSPEIYDFYKRSLKVNSRYSTLIHQESGSDPRLQNLFIEKAKGSVSTKPMQELERMLDVEEKRKPAWFSGDTKDWRDFFLKHAVFARYLKDFFTKYPDFPQPLVPVSLAPFPLGKTSQDNLPEWLDMDGNAPERSLVAGELAADLEEEIQTAKMAEVSERQYTYLRSTADEKSLKAVRYIMEQKRKAFSNVANFAQAIICLYFLRNWPELTVDPVNVPAATFKQVQAGYVPADQARKKRIEALAQSKDILISAESFALWIEKKLLEGKIIDSTQDLIDDDLFPLVDALLDEARLNGSNPDFQALRNTNKNAFQELNYEIKPLLGVLNEEEILYLQELTRVSKDSSMEPVIWEMAELISLRLQRLQDQGRNIPGAPKQTQIVLGHMQKFLKSWLGTNYSWAIMKLHESLVVKGGQLKSEEGSVSSSFIQDTVAVELAEEQTAPPAEVKEVEEVIKELKKDSLSGWSIYYTKDKTMNRKSFVEIGKDTSTLEVRGEQFTKFAREEQLPCTVPPASIIGSLGVVVMTPPETEWTRMRENVNGVTFKKYKHPEGMRTFYIMDPSKKEIIFFIYKKKELGYRF